MPKNHCYICRERKERGQFYKDASRNNLLTSGCKECLKRKAILRKRKST